MKDIKTFLIGFLTATCMFLLMGHTGDSSEEEYVKKMVMNAEENVSNRKGIVGKYMGFTDGDGNSVRIFRINTISGQVEYRYSKGSWKIF